MQLWLVSLIPTNEGLTTRSAANKLMSREYNVEVGVKDLIFRGVLAKRILFPLRICSITFSTELIYHVATEAG